MDLISGDSATLGFRKIISGGLTALATWAFTQYVPGFEDIPEATTSMIPAVVGFLTFWLVPEKVEVTYDKSR